MCAPVHVVEVKLDGGGTKQYTGDVRARYETALSFRVAERSSSAMSGRCHARRVAGPAISDYQLNIKRPPQSPLRVRLCPGQTSSSASAICTKEVYQRARIAARPRST
jgi:hypothetical protein